jgi:hypothetical protein
LDDLEHVYDGTAQSVTVITDPIGLTVDLTYNGNVAAPTNAGSYQVIGTVNDANYEGAATNTLVIAKGPADVLLDDLEHAYDGTGKSATASTTPSGLTVDLTYDGNAAAPTNAGSYEVIGTVEDDNYEGVATNTLVIAKAPADVMLDDLDQVYDGTAQSVTVITDPDGLMVELTYDGNAAAPTNAGSYEVIGIVEDDNYEGAATNTLVIAKAPAGVVLDDLERVYDGTAQSVTVITDPDGLTVAVTYDGNAAAPTNAGSYEVIGTVEDDNYEGAVTNTLVIAKGPADVILDNLEHVYDGTAKNATATTEPEGLTVQLTYDGNAAAPTNAGSYEVIGTVVDDNYAGVATNTLEIAKATATVTLDDLEHVYDGTAKHATATTDPPGLTVAFTYDGNAAAPTNVASYEVIGTIVDDNYEGENTDIMIIASSGFFTRTGVSSVGNTPRAIWLGGLRGNGTERDMVVANSGDNTVTVRLCLDNGTFGVANSYAVGLQPVAVRTADFNGDGFEDIVVANFGTNTVSVLMNLGYGFYFAPAANYVVGSTANPGPKAVSVGDINRDGRLDLLVANYNEDTVTVLYGLGYGAFGSLPNRPATNCPVGHGPSFIAVNALNQDRFVDAVVANALDGTLTILPGDTNGAFGIPQTIPLTLANNPVYVWACDVNSDDILDLVTANESDGTIGILLCNVLGGVLTVTNEYEIDVGLNPTSFSLRDFNKDGLVDLAVVNSGSDSVEFFFGDGNGGFDWQSEVHVGDTPVDIGGSNFNPDGATDFAVVNSGDNSVSIILFTGPVAYNYSTNVTEDLPGTIKLSGSLLAGKSRASFAEGSPDHGTLTPLTANTALYTPETNFWGTDQFNFVTVDTNNALTSAVATVTITVLPVNDAPSFDLSMAEIAVLEDAAVTNISNFATNLAEGPPNEASQTLSFVVSNSNNAFFAVKPTINSAGKLNFRPARNVTGTNTVTVKIKDNGGSLRGGTNQSPPQNFKVVVYPNPVKPLAGIYNGLFSDTNGTTHPSSGFFKFTLETSGLFTGKLTSDTGSYPFSGQFDTNGHVSGVEVVRNAPTLYLELQLDLINGSDEVTGSVAATNWVADLLGFRATFNAVTNPCPLVGRYTLVLPGDADAAALPGGDGYATIKVTSNGLLTATGKLGSSGGTLSQSVYLSKKGEWPFYLSLYSAQGSMLGWLMITNVGSESITGAVSWTKPATLSTYYPAGFTNEIEAMGSTYTQPETGERVLAMTNTVMIVSGGNLSATLTNAAYLAENNGVYIDTTRMLKLANVTNGLMSGSFVHPDLHSSKTLEGVVLQQQNQARGYFLGTDQSGAFLLLPND